MRIATEFEFVVCDTETDSGEKLWGVVGFDGAAKLAAYQEGYDANYEGVLLHQNPHAPLSHEFDAWEEGHLQAQNNRDDWELCNRERAQDRT